MNEDHEIMTERQEPHLAEENFNDEETAAYMRWHITTNN